MNIHNGHQFVANLGAIITVRLLVPQFICNQLAAIEGQLGKGGMVAYNALLAGKKECSS